MRPNAPVATGLQSLAQKISCKNVFKFSLQVLINLSEIIAWDVSLLVHSGNMALG